MTAGMTRRQLLAALGASGATAVLASCSGPAKGTQHAKTVAAPTKVPEEVDGLSSAMRSCAGSWEPSWPPGFKKYEPVVKLSSPFLGLGSTKWQHGDNFSHNPMADRMRDALGIEYTEAWVGTGDVGIQKMQQALATKSLPDVFYSWRSQQPTLGEVIDDGAVAEIKKIWEATASPLVKQIRAYPNGAPWTVVTRGDKIFGVPFLNGPAYNVDNLFNIRQDWLEKVGANSPRTLNDLADLMRAFRKQGLAEFGISVYQTLKSCLDPIFGAFGVMPTIWTAGPNGDLQYGSIQPGIKDALSLLRSWYKEGLIDPDFFTKTGQDWLNQTTAGKQGIEFSPWWVADWQAQMQQQNKSVRWTTLSWLPTGPEGKSGRLGSPVVDGAVTFRYGLDDQKIEAAINQLNWSTELNANWQKYKAYGEFRNSTAWTEGYEYLIKNCKMGPGPVDLTLNQYVYLDYVGFNFPGMCSPPYQSKVFSDMEAWRKVPETQLDMAQRFLLSSPVVAQEEKLYLIAANTDNLAVKDQFLGAPSKTMSAKMPDLQTLELQTFTKIIAGKSSLDTFDDFVKQWKTQGGDEITHDVNQWKRTH